MIRLLVSVRDAREARVAVAAGAGLIDFKEPNAGALGALDPKIIRDGLAAIAGACETSATTGDDPRKTWSAAAAIAETGVDYVKVGLFGDGQDELIARLGDALAERTRLVGVLIADEKPDFDLIPLMAEACFAGAMLDVAGKGRSLPDVMEPVRLEAFIRACRAHRLICGLAGSLRISHIPELAAFGPDIIGFRGGLCQKLDRTLALDLNMVEKAARSLASLENGSFDV